MGCPETLITDQGREFVNELSTALYAITKTEHRITSAYHPQVRKSVCSNSILLFYANYLFRVVDALINVFCTCALAHQKRRNPGIIY